MAVHHPLAVLALLVLTLAACGRGATSSTTSVMAQPLPTPMAAASSSTSPPVPTSSPSPTSSPTPAPSPVTSAPVATPTPTPNPPVASGVDTPAATPAGATPTQPPTDTDDLPGEPIDFGPRAGAVLAVIGVQYDDTLNLRAGPGTDQEVLARLAPSEDHVVARGATRTLPAFWYQVEVDGTVGWASARYLAWLGRTSDVTAGIVADLGSSPSADSMVDLGRIVAESQDTSTEPGSWITMSGGPSEMGDVASVTWDVVGLADDSVRGLRLHVVGTRTGGGYTLESVEQTLLCDRGVGDDGRCA